MKYSLFGINKSSIRHKIKAFTLAVFISIICSNTSAAFIISNNSSCTGIDTYQYSFTRSSVKPDYTVKVVKAAVMPDLTIKLVDDPRQADLVLVDSFENADMKICKVNSFSSGIKTIMVTEFSVMPDVTVLLSETTVLQNYKLFVRSSEISREEAAALFAVIWKANKDKR